MPVSPDQFRPEENENTENRETEPVQEGGLLMRMQAMGRGVVGRAILGASLLSAVGADAVAAEATTNGAATAPADYVKPKGTLKRKRYINGKWVEEVMDSTAMQLKYFHDHSRITAQRNKSTLPIDYADLIVNTLQGTIVNSEGKEIDLSSPDAASYLEGPTIVSEDGELYLYLKGIKYRPEKGFLNEQIIRDSNDKEGVAGTYYMHPAAIHILHKGKLLTLRAWRKMHGIPEKADRESLLAENESQLLMGMPPRQRGEKKQNEDVLPPKAAPEQDEVIPAPVVPEKAEDADRMKDAVEAVQKAGFITIEHAYDVNNKFESAIRAPSMVAPIAQKIIPITFTEDIEGDGRGEILIPCPRDVMDQIHLGTKVYVVKNGKVIDAPVELLYGKSGEKYTNPFIRLNLNGLHRKMTIRVLHYVSMPEYPDVPAQQLRQLAGPEAVATIGNAAKIAVSLRPSDDISASFKFTVEDAMRLGQGDCGMRARILRHFAPKYAEVAAGFSWQRPESIPTSGGRHGVNIIFTNSGTAMADVFASNSIYIGVQKNMLITEVGDDHIIEKWDDEKENGTNTGIHRGIADRNGFKVSIPGLGRDGAHLLQMQQNIPPEIQQLAEILQAKRMEVYAPKVAAGDPLAQKQ